MWAFATAILSAAFLVFLVQPLTARRLLPWLGGSPAVWIVSLLFFQSALFLGYVYARLICRALDARRQAVVHSVLVGSAVWFLPLGPHGLSSAAPENPQSEILRLLALNIGVPLLTLTATSPLLQTWLSHSTWHQRGSNVYRWFAVSNVGSLLGLLSYPFVVEPFVSVKRQVELWSAGFLLFTAAILACALYAYRSGAPASPPERLDAFWGERLRWVALSATGSVLLMASSSQLTHNVAAVPFLWVLPLALYLISFIIAFDRDRWYVRPLWGAIFVGSLFIILHAVGREEEPNLVFQIVIYSVNLLSGCMICHGELARRRPAAERLTTFYVIVAFGGLIGGIAVSVVAPVVFNGFWEYPIALFAVFVIGGACMPLEGLKRIYLVLGSLALGVILLVSFLGGARDTIVSKRGFFGVLQVYDDEGAGVRYLLNGPVTHGGQLLDPEERTLPILYYGPGTGVSLALTYDFGRPKRVGVVGLGTGSLAAYGRPGDRFWFFELNEQVVEVANAQFHYLEDSEAEISIVLGDARLRLEASEPLALDVLIVDAFAGDAIPVHLLTREAFAVYRRHLSPDGILAVHISNLHFDLEPVIRAQAEGISAVPVLVVSPEDPDGRYFATDWVLVTTNGAFLSDPDLAFFWEPRALDPNEESANFVWTDDYSNLFGALR